MATRADTSQLPVRYRVTAAAISIFVHALIFLPVFWQAGGRPGQQAVHDNSTGEASIQIAFVPADQHVPLGSSTAENAASQTADLQTTPARELSHANDGPLAGATAVPNKQTASPSTDEPRVPADSGAGTREESQLDPNDLYMSAMRAAVRREWQMSGGREILAGCKVAIDQVEGGKALRAWTMNCSDLTALERIRLETAVMRAQLPYSGFESQFEAHLELVL